MIKTTHTFNSHESPSIFPFSLVKNIIFFKGKHHSFGISFKQLKSKYGNYH